MIKLKGLLWSKGINGCGVIHSIKIPYSKLFNEACCLHDLLYDEGGKGINRFRADKILYYKMINASKSYLSKFFSLLYFIIVRLFGWLFFNYK